jgi:hypothetical protein
MFRAQLCTSSGALSNCTRSLRFPYKCRGGCVSSRGRFVSLTGGGDWSLKELLMMCTMVPETCWAASMRLSSKVYDRLLHLVGCFICLNIWRCTEPQTLNGIIPLGSLINILYAPFLTSIFTTCTAHLILLDLITRIIFGEQLTSSGQRNCASWSSQPQKSVTLLPCPGGKTTKSIRTRGGIR